MASLRELAIPLSLAEQHLDRFAPVERSHDPRPGRVAYWALTETGLRILEHDAGGPPRGDKPLADLGDAFQDYVTAFRTLQEATRG